MNDFMKKYKLSDDCLGRGSTCEVYRAHSKLTDSSYAVKMFFPTALSRESFELAEKEVNILKKLRGVPNVTQLIDNYFAEPFYGEEGVEQFQQVQVVDLVSGKNLVEIYTQFKVFSIGMGYQERFAKDIIRKLAQILKDVHSRGVAHLDVKMENVMLNPSSSKLVLVDFGLSETSDTAHSVMTTKCCGTLEYCAPEIIHSEKTYDGCKADVWSMGVLLLLLLTGKLHFHKGPPHSDLSSDSLVALGLSPVAQDLVSSMLRVNPSKRMTADEVLKHSWLSTSGSIGTSCEQERQSNTARSRLGSTM
eukprot:TRINITY_DN2056_c0_g1_i2.p1 TRINITY_DN2056_c0_g1~~TRINITY_DN2056_c0_g1_i2.p1  ORF type:complete len:305 (-),score=111.55 TRINITY_DN2056_c0_g1_i2:76-990(-)